MRNPIRRNRNIGTAKQGHGQNNRLEIPDSWRDLSVFYERLVSPVKITREIHGKTVVFLIEPTLRDFQHSCTIDDIQKLSELLPPDDILNIDMFVLRQPTRKQVILNYPWGRLAHYYESNNCIGTAIVIEAQEVNKSIKWRRSVCPQEKLELERLKNDGHLVTSTKRYIEIDAQIDNCRNTQLFRTIPHEVGHYVHYLKVGSDKIYDAKPQDEKEAFAHRYADEFRAKMQETLKIPFSRILCEESLRRDNLQLDWFQNKL